MYRYTDFTRQSIFMILGGLQNESYCYSYCPQTLWKCNVLE